jgi:DNA-binding transcriptional ArsR family regulator
VFDADLAAVATLMTGHRATILLALCGGAPLPAGELAARCQISPSLTSAHLAKLLDGGLVVVERDGRRRSYRLAGEEVADVIEAMVRIAPPRAASSFRAAQHGNRIRRARTCYDHLAGELGVALTDALRRTGRIRAVDAGFAVTPSGERWFTAFGVDLDGLRSRRRAFARSCLDWTERRPHLAGSLGAGLTDRLLELGWVRRVDGSRAVLLSEAGADGLRAELDVRLAA